VEALLLKTQMGSRPGAFKGPGVINRQKKRTEHV